MEIIYQLIQSTYLGMTVLLIVALGGLLAERSGVTNIALEGIMIFGAFIGVWGIKIFERYLSRPSILLMIMIVLLILILLITILPEYRYLKKKHSTDKEWKEFKIASVIKVSIAAVVLLISILLTMVVPNIATNPQTILQSKTQMILIMGLTVGGLIGGLFSMIHAYASIYLKANQVISATALNLFAPAFAVFTARILQGGQQISFMSNFMINKVPLLGDIPLIGDIFFKRNYLSFYFSIGLLILLSILIYKSKFGLRLRACGENPHAADSLGINIYRLRFKAVTLSGVLAGIGGVSFVISTSTEFNVTVAGFGFLAIAVLIFGNWSPKGIVLAALFFGFMRTIASSFSIIPFLNRLGAPAEIYNMIPFIATLIILGFFSKNSRAPKALGQVYDQGKR